MPPELSTAVVLDVQNVQSTTPARLELEPAAIKLDYMVSRLRMAIRTWRTSHCSTEDEYVWWWKGLTYELVGPLTIHIENCNDSSSKTAAMSIVGHSAALGIPIEVPAFLRGLSSSMIGQPGPFFSLSQAMQEDIDRDVDGGEYYENWWVHSSDKDRRDHRLLDIAKAFQFHRNKVRINTVTRSPYIIGHIE
jgi:hypothetical protein